VPTAKARPQGNGYSLLPAISADGRFVVFFSEAWNLVPADTNEGGASSSAIEPPEQLNA
jgi:hypothetical protein